uniref:Uncharacterized protein n=1 Tax=Opuntia streptacantha TaxID=393608 RepID=A0A7C9EM57_OPUST
MLIGTICPCQLFASLKKRADPKPILSGPIFGPAPCLISVFCLGRSNPGPMNTPNRNAWGTLVRQPLKTQVHCSSASPKKKEILVQNWLPFTVLIHTSPSSSPWRPHKS